MAGHLVAADKLHHQARGSWCRQIHLSFSHPGIPNHHLGFRQTRQTKNAQAQQQVSQGSQTTPGRSIKILAVDATWPQKPQCIKRVFELKLRGLRLTQRVHRQTILLTVQVQASHTHAKLVFFHGLTQAEFDLLAARFRHGGRVGHATADLPADFNPVVSTASVAQFVSRGLGGNGTKDQATGQDLQKNAGKHHFKTIPILVLILRLVLTFWPSAPAITVPWVLMMVFVLSILPSFTEK